MSPQNYLVTARKYRPQRFDEVIAQEHVTETLKNAIRLDRLAHAYLFSGPRGVGKTSVARILAKAINCTAPPDSREDGEPCLVCDSCQSFSEGRNLSVIEIDAASNNKVDDVRELRETVRVPPQGAEKKVYIVDEVHMLSNAAFNALLKTLEEPPPYVLFIFATTEPNKVLPTILSRCQRFDFRRIAVPEIVQRLEDICRAEKVKADDASLMLIARKGDGALRDALSAFDQATSLCGTELTYAELAAAFRVVDVDLFFRVTDCATNGNSAAILTIVEEIVRAGYDLHEFLVGLAGHLRNLLVAHTMPDTSLIEATVAARERYASVATSFTEGDLLRMMMVVSQTEDSMRNSAQPRLHVELGLLKLAQMGRIADLQMILNRLDEIQPNSETILPSAGPGKAEVAPSPPTRKRVAVAPPEVTEPDAAKPDAAKSDAAKSDAAKSDAAIPATSEKAETGRTTKKTPKKGHPVERETPNDAPHQDVVTEPVQPKPASGLFGPPALTVTRPGKKKDADRSMTEGSAALATSEEPVPERRGIEAIWLKFVGKVKSERIHVGSLLQHTAPVAFAEGAVAVAVPDEFHKRLLSNQESFLLSQLKIVTDEPVSRLSFAVREDVAAAKTETAAEFDPYEYMQRKRNESPIIQAIFDEFGGELVW